MSVISRLSGIWSLWPNSRSAPAIINGFLRTSSSSCAFPSLEKAAIQLFWDFEARQDVTYEELVYHHRQRYGTEGIAETFHAQLYYRPQPTEETLRDLIHGIRRLVLHTRSHPTRQSRSSRETPSYRPCWTRIFHSRYASGSQRLWVGPMGRR